MVGRAPVLCPPAHCRLVAEFIVVAVLVLVGLAARQTSKHTLETGALQKGADFLRAFVLGFEVRRWLAFVRCAARAHTRAALQVQDCVAILRLDDLCALDDHRCPPAR